MRHPLAAIAAFCALALLPATARAASAGSYAHCAAAPGTTLVEVARTSCTAAAAAALAAGAALDPAQAPAAVAATGWTPIRALPTPAGDGFDLVALRGGAALRIRRPGSAPDLDGYEAGRELIFARPRIQPGATIPDGAAACTSAFLIHVGSALAGLSAAHCAGLHSNGTIQRPNVGQRRPPVPGIVLGAVRSVLERTAAVDALTLPVPAGRPAPAIVNRGIDRPPWIVAGTASPTAGRAICLTGRTSGVDVCGRVATLRGRIREEGGSARKVEVVCSSVPGREGDSGGPVYTKADRHGRVYAIGTTTVGIGFFGDMCFTPITPILAAAHATIATG